MQTTKVKKPWYKITPYLDKPQIENVLGYKFHGGCDSWLFLNFWSPIADWCVSKLPRNLAANCVTLFGFLFTILPMIWLFGQYGTTFSNPVGVSIPWWMFIVQSISYFLARLLDEMDGKQARRLKNGSILGLLVDHGCDGYSMGFFAMIFAKLGQVGDNTVCMLAVSTSTFGFYVSTLEHYYTQNHFMGPGNAVTDGSFAVIIIWAALAIVGNDFMAEVVSKDIPYTYGNLFGVALIIISSCNVIAYTYYCVTHKLPSEYTKKQFNGVEFLQQILGFVLMVLVTSSLLFMGESPLLYQPASNFEGRITPLLSILLLQNFLMAHMNFCIIINHVSQQIYNPFQNKVVIFTCVYVAGIYIAIKNHPEIDIMNAIYVLWCMNIVFSLHFIISIARQLKEVLCIPFFFTFDPAEREKLLKNREEK